VTDVLTGLYAAVAVHACLQARHQSGHGYTIDLALLDCAIAAQVNVAQAYLTGGQVPPRQDNAHLQIVPYQLFQTADGWIVLAVGNDHQWQHFCHVAERPDLAQEERYRTNTGRVTHRQELVPQVEAIMKKHTTAQWQEMLVKADVAHAPVWNYQELFSQPQAVERGWRLTVRDPDGKPVDLVGSPFHINEIAMPAGTTPPGLGADSEAVLKEVLGLETSRIAELRDRGVV
jgi:crotonobetainyl-CoA:carnitine CoA-transferase CaiB-like acyl-CoA transferase